MIIAAALTRVEPDFFELVFLSMPICHYVIMPML